MKALLFLGVVLLSGADVGHLAAQSVLWGSYGPMPDKIASDPRTVAESSIFQFRCAIRERAGRRRD